MRHREVSAGAFTSLWTRRAYNAFGEVASETDALDHATTYAYNTMGRLMKTTRPTVDVRGEDGVLTQAFAPVEWSFSDLAGRTVGVQDAKGRRTARLLLAGTGHMSGGGGGEALVVKEWHADQNSVLNGYNRFGDRVRATDELRRETTMTHDEMGRLTGVTRPSKQWERYDYDQLGQRIRHYTSAIPSAQGETTTYDRQGRVTATRGFGGAGTGEVTKTSYEWQASLSNAGLGTSGGWKQITTAANDRVSSELSDVFGHVTYSADLGSHVTEYTYDMAGRLAKSVTTGGETVRTRWLNTGLAGVVTSDLGTAAAPERGRAAYGYDAAGRKTSESYVLDGTQRQNATARYDTLGRMVEWREAGNAVVPGSFLLTDYDAVGNVVHTRASHVGLDAQGNWTAAKEEEVWTRHDVMNRVTVAGGSLVNNAIVRGTKGQDLTYDAAGERATATRTVRRSMTVPNPTYNPGNENGSEYTDDRLIDNNRYRTVTYDAAQREDFAYDGDGRLVDVRVAESTATYKPSTEPYEEGTVTVAPPPAEGKLRGHYTYDKMGRLEYQADYAANGTTVVYDRALAYDAQGRVRTETTNLVRDGQTVRTVATTGYGTGTGSALGAPVTVSAETYVDGSHRSTATTTHDYAWYTGAVQDKTTHRPDSAKPEVFTTDYAYDTAGRLTGVTIADGRPRDVAFINDLAGQALARDEADRLAATGDPHERWYRFDGREMGSISNDGTDETSYAVSIDRRLAAAAPTATGPFRDGGGTSVANADYDGQVRSITSFSSASDAGGLHTVREGDTLAGLAASLWGDAGLWYKLASANGLSAASALVPGQTLTIPSGVTRSGRTASTFKPFDAGEVAGDLSPTTPKPQAAAAKHKKCGAFGAILLAAVAVAVSVATYGALSPVGAALTGWSAVGAGALAGAAGSLVSQGVGLATGLQDKFSFKNVALAALGGAVGAGLAPGGLAGPSGAFGKIGSSLATDVLRGVATSAITQGIGVATGLQSKFDFVGVAAAGVGAGVGGAVGRGLKLTGFDVSRSAANVAGSALAGTASAIANAATRSAIEGSNFGDNVMRALPDAIGSTVGNLIGSALQGPSQVALAKALESPVEANKPMTGQAVAGAVEAEGGWVNVAAIARATDAVLERNNPLNFGLDPALEQGIAELNHYAAVAQARSEGDATIARVSKYYQSLSESEKLTYKQANGIPLPRSVNDTRHGNNYLVTVDGGWSGSYLEHAVRQSDYDQNVAQNGGPFSNSRGIVESLAADRARLDTIMAYADRQVWELTSSVISPLGSPTAAYRMAVNGEINWGNGITVAAGLVGLGALGKEIAVGAKFASAGRAAESAGARTNFNVYEVLSEQPISGATRGAHRNSANRALYRDLQSNPEFARMLDAELGADVINHMSSGRNLLNPPGTVWHHPTESANVLQLLRSTEHTNPLTQPVLHPKGIGGFGTHYGN